jgi:hypothetical protein
MIINFTTPIDNASLQIGDSVYTSSPPIAIAGTGQTQVSGYDLHGIVVSIGPSWIESDGNDTISADSFITFCKDSSANTSGLKGYYASVKMRNNSEGRAELFAISSDITESSK